MKIKILVLVLLCSVVSCKELRDNTPQEISKLKDQVSELTDSLSGYIVDSPSASTEIKKLYQYEYKILQYPIKNLQLLEGHLSELGKERWDCFDTEKLISEGNEPLLIIFCKRKPETPLKYIPKTLLGS